MTTSSIVKFLKIFFILLLFFILQSVFEILLMSFFAKIGIAYMNVEVRGESYREVIEAVSVFYFYSKVFYFAPAYFIISIVSIFYLSHKRDITLKVIAIVHLLVNALLFLVLWFYFGNGFGLILNPLLGLLLAGLIIYFLASKNRKVINNKT